MYISCDQVAWLMDIFERYLPANNHPRVSVEREMMQYGMLYEVMDIAGLQFADDAARLNGTPPSARPCISDNEDRGKENSSPLASLGQGVFGARK